MIVCVCACACVCVRVCVNSSKRSGSQRKYRNLVSSARPYTVLVSISLYSHYFPSPPPPLRPDSQTGFVHFHERGGSVSREQFMMVLADLSSLKIRASYTQLTTESRSVFLSYLHIPGHCNSVTWSLVGVEMGQLGAI